MRFFNDTGIILQKTPFRERDEIVFILTKHHGKISFVAYGSQMQKSKKAGSVQPFNTIEFLARTYVRNRPSLEQVKVLSSRGFSLAKRSLKEYTRAVSFVKTIGLALAEGQHAEKIYDLLEEAFLHLESELIPYLFFIKTFTFLGFLPLFRQCCHCHVKIQIKDKILFCAENKGCAHQKCCIAFHMTGIPMSFLLVKIMAFFQTEEISKGTRVDVPKVLQKQMATVLEKITVHGSL